MRPHRDHTQDTIAVTVAMAAANRNRRFDTFLSRAENLSSLSKTENRAVAAIATAIT